MNAVKARETIDTIGFVTLVAAPTVAVAAGIVQAAAARIDLLALGPFARTNKAIPTWWPIATAPEQELEARSSQAAWPHHYV